MNTQARVRQDSTVENSIVVIILTFNQRDTTLNCLHYLLADKEAAFDVLVWDNGSQDGTEAAVRAAYPQVHFHYHPENLGVAGGRNAAAGLAIERFQPEFLLFLDNDMEVQPGFISALAKPLLEDPRAGQTQGKLLFLDDRQRINDGGGARINYLFWEVTPVGYQQIDRGQYESIKPCISCGGAMMVRTSVFQELGGFDLIFNPFGPEDLDFSLRLKKSGYQALYVPQAVTYHAVNHTFGSGYSEVYARHKSRHWFRFMRRHASIWQQLGFFTIGAPFLVVRTVVREARRGNLGALRGLFFGIFDTLRSSFHRKG